MGGFLEVSFASAEFCSCCCSWRRRLRRYCHSNHAAAAEIAIVVHHTKLRMSETRLGVSLTARYQGALKTMSQEGTIWAVLRSSPGEEVGTARQIIPQENVKLEKQ